MQSGRHCCSFAVKRTPPEWGWRWGAGTCARTEESCVSTMEWMMLCGWITMSMLSYDAP